MERSSSDQFLGPQLGTYYGYPVYEPDKPAFYQSITPEQFRASPATSSNMSSTWTHNFNVQLTNPELFQLPAGPVGVAAWSSSATSTGTTRWIRASAATTSSASAAPAARATAPTARSGVEFSMPLFKQLTASLSGRYDSYKNIGAGSDAKVTYKLGLEFRPIDTPADPRQLRHRVPRARTWATCSPAATASSPADRLLQVRDVWRQPASCRLRRSVAGGRAGGQPGPEVDQRQVLRLRLRLVAERALRRPRRLLQRQDRGRGAAAVVLAHAVRRERMPAGPPGHQFPTCVDALSRVQRGPVNAESAAERSGAAGHDQGRSTSPKSRSPASSPAAARASTGAGVANSASGWTTTSPWTTPPSLSPAIRSIDLLSPQQALSAEFKSMLTGDISWEKGDWSANVHGIRYGSLPNYAAQFGVRHHAGNIARPGRACTCSTT